MKGSKGSIKNSPAASSKEKNTSGKKLVQARLPFKILSSPVPVGGAPLDSEKRKRKISDGDLPASKILCSSKTKENLSKSEEDAIVLCEKDTIILSDDETHMKESIHEQEGTSSLNPVVQLNKIDEFIENSRNDSGKIILSPKTSKIPKKSGRCRSGSANKSGKSNQLHIKLPISNKKRRKLSEKLNMARSSDDEGTSKKKFKVYSEEARDGKDSLECDVVEIKDDEASLSAEICLQVTMSQDSLIKPIIDSKKTIESSSSQLETNEIEGTFKKPAQSTIVIGGVGGESLTKLKKVTNTNEECCKNEDDKTNTAETILLEQKSFQGQESSSDDVMDNTQIVKSGDAAESSDRLEEKECSNLNDDGDSVEIDSDGERKGQTPLKDSESATKLQQRAITPRQLQKYKEREEKQKQREEERLLRQKEKEEKERLRKKEREEKEEQRRKEKEEKEEQKRREKEEKDEQRRKEKEEKEKKRLAEIEAKNEERRQKEEEKRKKEEQKEEERRKKEDDRKRKEQEKEEAENKKRKAAEAFTKFFLHAKGSGKDLDDDQSSLDSENVKNSNFMPFQVKGDMKLAPIFRKILDYDAKAQLDTILEDHRYSVPHEDLYLNSLKSGKNYPGKDSRTWFIDDGASDCLVIEDELERAGETIDESSKPRQKYRAKFLHFHQNQRPPYYGTWRKKSIFVKPRKPFATDTSHFDYEVDSDDEWEEEEPGESLHGSDDEKESEDEYEVDNEFFVPHGHLSDEELQNEDEVDDDNSPQIQKEKLKLLQQEFAQEMKKKTEKIKPRLLGIVWQEENGSRPDLCPSIIWESLNKRAMIFSGLPIITELEKAETESGSPVQEKKPLKRTQLDDDQIKNLIRLVHGNRHKKEFMVREFQAFMTKQTAPEETPVEYTKTSIKEQIDKIAEWKAVENKMKKKKTLCWMVFPDVFKQYDLEVLSDMNSWEYILTPRRVLSEIKTDEIMLVDEPIAEKKEKESTIKKRKKKEKKNTAALTKLTTVVSKESEKSIVKKFSKPVEEFLPPSIEIDAKPMDTPSFINNASKSSPAVKKRVPLLMSVPRGQKIPENTKNALISDFLKKRPNTTKDPPDTPESNKPMEVDAITID